VALRRDLAMAQGLIAAGRLRLVSHYDDRRIPDLTLHEGRATVEPGLLAALADGTLGAPRVVPLRRHVAGCPSCEDAVEMMAKGRRLAAALPVVAMPDDARELMLERVAERAHSVLPSVEDVLLAIDEDDETPPAISPIVAVLAIVVALVLGVAVAAVTASRPGGDSVALASPQPASVAPSFPTGSPTRSRSPKPHRSTTPTTTATATLTRSAPPTGPPTTAPATASDISIDPTSGPRGTSISVTGSGWTPGTLVTVRYSGTLAGSGSTAAVDDSGHFTTSVNANAALPGSYTVSATDGSATASQPFRQTS
jgi:hypothetical protein